MTTPRGSRYSTTLSLTSTLEEGGWLMPRPHRLAPEKDILYPLLAYPRTSLDGCVKSR